jgi:DNA-binding response OmpR family regulator
MNARKRVLIIEPDPAAREATLSYLTSCGHEALAVADEKAAVLTAASFRPLAIVLDPLVSRYPRSFVEVLRQTVPHDMLIVATAATRLHDAWLEVFDISLLKPFALDELHTLLATWSLVHAA